ncbi:acyl-CoA thioesterase [Granulicella cerasi]|uniref:Acyl-CoA thioesterase n=1 Tax=Granulicella cerasi TaxID=741063 RepID=A0ABW1ZFL7_9BACT|nr:thioesterase family protein [Granulicella cerasi]
MEALLERGFSETRLRVRYAETDQMGVVYHANYLVWMEVGRVEFVRETGLDYAAMEREDNALIAVVNVNVRYKSPARYDDEILVRTKLAEARGSIIRFTYSVVRESDGAELATGETVHVVVDREMKRTRIPARFAERFEKLLPAKDEA